VIYVAKKEGSRKHYICHDCVRRFTVYGFMQKRPFCPQCGDSVSVERWKPQNKTSRTEWTNEEFLQARTLRAAGLSWAAIGIKIGRSRGAVRRKFDREENKVSGLYGEEKF